MACIWFTITNSLEQTQKAIWASLHPGHACTFLLRYIGVAVLSKWNCEADGPENMAARSSRSSRFKVRPYNTNGRWTKQLCLGFFAAFSFRRSGTPYEAKNVPKSIHTNSCGYLKRTSLQVLCSYPKIHYFNSANRSPENASWSVKQNIPLLARLHNVTSQKFLVRRFTTVSV